MMLHNTVSELDSELQHEVCCYYYDICTQCHSRRLDLQAIRLAVTQKSGCVSTTVIILKPTRFA